MDLKEFISQALNDIVEGVVDAQSHLKENGKHINPRISRSVALDAELLSADGQRTQKVEFDVAVTAAEAKGAKGGIGIVAGAFALGGQGSQSAESSAISRIKFSIPITLPYGQNQKV